MSVNAVVSKGILFKIGDGASNELFTSISEMNSIGLPNISRPMIDVTDLSSVAREFIPGLLDYGQVRIGMNFVRDNYIDFHNRIQSDVSDNYQIVIPDTGSTTIQFTAYVQNIGGESGGPDDKISVPVDFKITGAITISS